MTISLNPVHQGGEGRRLASGSLLIGRDPRAQIRIADPTASGRHCVISGEGDPARSRTAMDAATRMLVDDELKVIKLFTPPFSSTAETTPSSITSVISSTT